MVSVILYSGFVCDESVDLMDDLVTNGLLSWLGQCLLSVRVKKQEGRCAGALSESMHSPFQVMILIMPLFQCWCCQWISVSLM